MNLFLRNLSLRASRFRPAPCIAYVREYSKGSRFPDPLELSTGIAKREMLAIQAGNKDPFGMEAVKRGPGTKENPNLVPSMLDKRMIGCICEEDSASINYMWLHKGEPKRCECGYWFKLVEGKFI
ncbi:cytochrome c oxidase subunit 5B, mitochondrial-like [Varroa jacobsoni]|uniref:Cytochrome c oxidase subunit 5B, mitochondrial n=1 Tax=Varroa destructor TaxID=109461 RepID=A0A7M7K9R3_VARDE|nr:cytochrome c oxidase subunit 5B, mitochondrial-like [Varroa destructor]XP_022707929.1 cytochrome c oxidase subunit 5B, mitochondrial-like [Varroa jacobsoni]